MDMYPYTWQMCAYMKRHILSLLKMDIGIHNILNRINNATFLELHIFLVEKFSTTALFLIDEYMVQFLFWCAANRDGQCTICCFKTKCLCELIMHQSSSDIFLLDSRMIAKAKNYPEIVKTSVSYLLIGTFGG